MHIGENVIHFRLDILWWKFRFLWSNA
jgi:hypothetical protein